MLPRVFIQKDNKNLLLSTWRDDGIRARIRKLCALGTGLAEKHVKMYASAKITCVLYGYVSVIKSVILTPLLLEVILEGETLIAENNRSKN